MIQVQSARRRAASLLAGAMLGAPTLSAQAPAVSQVRADSLSCDGLMVTAVDLEPEEPAILGGRTPGWARPILRIMLQSRRTDTSAVRPFLLLGAGSACDEHQRAESERLLRAQPYLADASVQAVPDGAGGVRLVVRTIDEVPLLIGGGLRDGAPSQLLLGNGNVMGQGILAAAEWERGYAYRDGWGAHLTHYHVLGRRQRVELHAVRAPLTEWYQAAIAHPYLTDGQRLAWYGGYARQEGYVAFTRADADPLSLGMTRDIWGLAGLARIGGRTRRLIAGATVGYERGRPSNAAVVVSDTGFVASSEPVFAERFAPFQATRIAAIGGARLLRFRRVQGLDALAGAQDVASGVQLMTALGYELGTEGGDGSERVDTRQPFAAVDFYAGRALARGLTAFALGMEGRRATIGSGWDDVVANGRLAWYYRPSRRRTRAISAEYQGAWDARRPYRVMLGNWNSGVRGYGGSRAAGARLAVLRVEERLSMGGMGSLVGLGGAAFTDIGKLWAGDVPFGRSTAVRPSVGAGLLVAVPRRSQGFWRADVAAPLARDAYAPSWTLRISRALPYQSFLRESGDLARARSTRPSSMLVASP